MAEALEGQVPANVRIAPLYGALDGKAQDAAIRPAKDGERKVVLATSIAQTSLTIEGVRTVIDSGLSRVPRYEPQTGLTRLETVRVSRATADQRRGRAGRTEPGVCYRLWDEAQTHALMPAERPQILEADLSSLVLDLAAWGTADPATLSFPDAPPSGAWAEARSLLTQLHALDAEGRLTPHGQRLARLPIEPRLAHMIVEAEALGLGRLAGEVAAILSEPGLGGMDVDLRERVRRLRRDNDPRSRDARALAARWQKMAAEGSAKTEQDSGGGAPELAGEVLALAFPERVAQRRGQRGRFRLANGRGRSCRKSMRWPLSPSLPLPIFRARPSQAASCWQRRLGLKPSRRSLPPISRRLMTCGWSLPASCGRAVSCGWARWNLPPGRSPARMRRWWQRRFWGNCPARGCPSALEQ